MEISREIIRTNFEDLVQHVFELPEVYGISTQSTAIFKEQSMSEREKKLAVMMEECYHDEYSDIDLHILVQLSPQDSIKPDSYMKLLSRYGIHREDCLGIQKNTESHLYRIVMKNGMRYDLKFEFVENEHAELLQLEEDFINDLDAGQELEKADCFWFVQIQALGKLYRRDFLISDHLANMNLNETLVMQMIMRDEEYGTNVHRYGYSETLEYMQALQSVCPYEKESGTFAFIARKLYAASLAFDRLAEQSILNYEKRSHLFFEIWDCYEKNK